MTRKNKQQGPIGIFDSGVGGLSVLREVRDQYPGEDLIYIADQIHVPYGTRSREEVLKFSEGIVRFLLGEGVKLVVLACNTASAAALAHLRKIYPALPFVGMEPAVKPAAEETSTGVVGILATPATFQGELYASTMERFARGVKVLQDTCPGLVDQIEAGMIDHPRTREILEKALKPMLDQGIDKVVMGCTHYPFVIPIIEEIAGDGVRVIDPAPAVARQTGRLLEAYHLEADRKKGSVEFLTTGDPESFSRTIAQLVGLETAVGQVNWHDGDLEKSSD
jgi:glutamate racemase